MNTQDTKRAIVIMGRVNFAIDIPYPIQVGSEAYIQKLARAIDAALVPGNVAWCPEHHHDVQQDDLERLKEDGLTVLRCGDGCTEATLVQVDGTKEAGFVIDIKGTFSVDDLLDLAREASDLRDYYEEQVF